MLWSICRMSIKQLLCTSFLSLLLLLSCSDTSGLSYPFAENTPGTTNWNGLANVAVPATGGAAMAIPANRLMSDHGTDKQGNAYDCRALIEQISDENRNTAGVAPGAVEPGSPNVRNYLSGSVIGIALVDVGTAIAPDVRAFYAPSGHTTPHIPATDALAKTWLTQRIRFPIALTNVDHWQIVRSTSPYTTESLMRHRRGNYVQTLAGAAAAWAGVAPAPAATPEGIQFAVDDARTTVYKKWGAAGWFDSSLNVGGTCALQKLTTTLYGFNEAIAIPRLQAGAQALVGAGSRLICVAEATHNLAQVPVKPWGADVVTNYPTGAEVPSCVVCQAVIPEIIDGSFVGCNVDALKPVGFTVGTCPPYLSPFGGANCQLGCPQGQALLADAGALPTVTCVDGALVVNAAIAPAHLSCGLPCERPAVSASMTLGNGATRCDKPMRHGQRCQQTSKSSQPLSGGYGVNHETQCLDGVLNQPEVLPIQQKARSTHSAAEEELEQKLRTARQSVSRCSPSTVFKQSNQHRNFSCYLSFLFLWRQFISYQ